MQRAIARLLDEVEGIARPGRSTTTSSTGASRVHHDDAIAEQDRLVEVVGHEHHRLPARSPRLEEELLGVDSRLGIEGRERLVHQDDVGLDGPGAGQRDALAHPLRKLPRPEVVRLGEAEAVEQLPCPPAAFLAPDVGSPELEGELDVPARGPPRQQRVAGEHVRDVLARLDRASSPSR